MTRILPKITIRPAPIEDATDSPEWSMRDGWEGFIEGLCMIALIAMIVVSMALGAPEPIDCGVDRNAPTLEKGCGDAQ